MSVMPATTLVMLGLLVAGGMILLRGVVPWMESGMHSNFADHWLGEG